MTISVSDEAISNAEAILFEGKFEKGDRDRGVPGPESDLFFPEPI